jgi:hypothetical protein
MNPGLYAFVSSRSHPCSAASHSEIVYGYGEPPPYDERLHEKYKHSIHILGPLISSCMSLLPYPLDDKEQQGCKTLKT